MPIDSAEALNRIQSMSYEELKKQIRRGERTEDLQALFGPTLGTELEQILQASAPALLGGIERPLVLILPGIMGSTLVDRNLGQGIIWLNPLEIVRGALQRLQLAADGRSGPADAHVVANELFPAIYLLLRVHLEREGCQVEVFPFDWRYMPEVSADLLRAELAALFAREQRKIFLVCHSMGGLVARAYCQAYPDESEAYLARLIMIAPPHAGSYQAVENLTGGGTVPGIQALSRGFDVPGLVRGWPGVYSMLPAPRSAYPGDASRYPFRGDFAIYQAQAYRTDSVHANHLATANQRYQRIRAGGAVRVPATIIAGTGLDTCVGVTVDEHGLRFTEIGDGDGTVPLESATAMPEAQVHTVSKGKHLTLPLDGDVRRAVTMLVYGVELDQSITMRAGVLGVEDQPIETPNPPIPVERTPATTAAAGERVRDNGATPADILVFGGL